jgi:hypothetical protein
MDLQELDLHEFYGQFLDPLPNFHTGVLFENVNDATLQGMLAMFGRSPPKLNIETPTTMGYQENTIRTFGNLFGIST